MAGHFSSSGKEVSTRNRSSSHKAAAVIPPGAMIIVRRSTMHLMAMAKRMFGSIPFGDIAHMTPDPYAWHGVRHTMCLRALNARSVHVIPPYTRGSAVCGSGQCMHIYMLAVGDVHALALCVMFLSVRIGVSTHVLTIPVHYSRGLGP